MKCKQCGREMPEAAFFCCWFAEEQGEEAEKRS